MSYFLYVQTLDDSKIDYIDRSLIQILDSEVFDLMHQNGDYTHFYFCYRWFLLDFKRGKLCIKSANTSELIITKSN